MKYDISVLPLLEAVFNYKYNNKINWTDNCVNGIDIEFEYSDTRLNYEELITHLEKNDIFKIIHYKEEDISNSMSVYPDFHWIVYLNVCDINWMKLINIANYFFKESYLIYDGQFGELKTKKVLLKCIFKKAINLGNKEIIFSENDCIDYYGNFDFLNGVLSLVENKFIDILDININSGSFVLSKDSFKNRFIFTMKIPSLDKIKSFVQEQHNELRNNVRENYSVSTNNPVYSISFLYNGVVLINNIKLTKTQFDKENFRFLEYVVKRPGKKITLQEIEKGVSGKNENFKFKKEIKNIIQNLGFTGDIKKLFFPNISNRAVEFRNPIYKKDLDDNNIKYLEFGSK